MAAKPQAILAENGAVASNETNETPNQALICEVQSEDRWTSRARPTFLYVSYILLLWAIPMGVLAAFHPVMARTVTQGMAAHFATLPEALSTLFGTGYRGYTAARTWGKIRGVEG